MKNWIGQKVAHPLTTKPKTCCIMKEHPAYSISLCWVNCQKESSFLWEYVKINNRQWLKRWQVNGPKDHVQLEGSRGYRGGWLHLTSLKNCVIWKCAIRHTGRRGSRRRAKSFTGSQEMLKASIPNGPGGPWTDAWKRIVSLLWMWKKSFGAMCTVLSQVIIRMPPLLWRIQMSLNLTERQLSI